MDFCGVICEFNPFHNGHEYLINQAKKQLNEDVVCLMSGNFVQRGIPAIQEKYERAKNAILAGANAVFELPTIFACSNAENFAFGAIKIFKALNVKHIAFGIENTNLETLQKIAKIKFENSQDFQNCFKNEIENGINYNTALKRSISKQFENEMDILKILESANNVLAIEYLTAILKLNAKIIPIAINRIDNGYFNSTPKNQYLSATAIREKILNNKDVSNYIPSYAKITKIFNNIDKSKFDFLNLLTIRTLEANNLEKHYDYNEGIEYRIKEMANKATSLEQLSNLVSSARYRKARVDKLLLYPVLKITKQIVNNSKTSKPAIKLLAIQKQNKYLLSNYNKLKINLIVTNKDYDNLSKTQKQVIEIDLNASNIYNTIIQNQNNNDKKIGVLFV